MARKSKLIETRGASPWFFVDPTPIEDPACVRDENDPHSAFAQYLMTRLVKSKDEASKDVLAAVKAGRGVADAAIDAIQALPAGKTKKLRAWMDEATSSRVYAYAEIFQKDGTAEAGLMLTEGGPKDKALAREQILNDDLDVGRTEYRGADAVIVDIEDGAGRSDEGEYVHVFAQSQYDRALKALGKTKSRWEKPGIYFFDGGAPSYVGTVKEYEFACAYQEAESMIRAVRQDDVLHAACGQLRKGAS